MRASRIRRFHSGQVFVVVLLGVSLLAGLVFYVINVGDQVDRRVVMQNSADATAISGAAWMARCMNVVAMNNVAQTRMLALIPTLDAFPLSVEMAHEEVDAWVQCVTNQLQRGVTDPHLEEGLESLRDRLERQRDILAPMDQLFNSTVDVEAVTNWPDGELWRAAESMDLFSQAIAVTAGDQAQATGVLAQKNAARYGQLDHAEVAFVVPVLPQLPAVRTSYNDFELPVKTGLIPDDLNRGWPSGKLPHHRKGPYDRLFKWRDYVYLNTYANDRWVPGQPGHGAIRGSQGNVSIGGRRVGQSARGHTSNPSGHWAQRVVGRTIVDYRVYGPYEWMRRRVQGYARNSWASGTYSAGQLADTFFHEYHRKVADIKLDYMWGSHDPKYIHYPQWSDAAGAVIDYPAALTIAADNRNRITRTMFYLVETRSRYEKGTADWMTPDSYVSNGKAPVAIWVNGWQDPATWGIKKTDDWVWEDQYFYETTEDKDIGIKLTLDPTTRQPIWEKVYMVAQYVFGGIDVGGEVEVSNPARGSTRDDSGCCPCDMPAPILMDISLGDYDISQPHHDLGVRRDVFTYLGVAATSNRPKVWATRFGSPSPYPNTVAVAQSTIFNTASWDLWTPDWKSKLVPVTQWEDWMQRMDEGAPDAADSGGLVEVEDVTEIHEYLSRFDPNMVDRMMNH